MRTPMVTRYYYLDSLRAVLMMLGVLLHSAQVFNPQGFWLITNSETSIFFHYVTEFIHLFRMPAFFFISGFFCCLTLEKYAVTKFLTVRIPRLFIPLLVTALTLNSLQTYVLTQSGWLAFDLAIYLSQGQWVSHLWFLVNLSIYFLLAAGFKLLFDCVPLNGKKLLYLVSKPSACLLLLTLPLLSLSILALNKIGFPLYSKYFGIFDIYSLLRYAPFFIIGYFAYLCLPFFNKLVALPKVFLIAIMAILFIFQSSITVDSTVLTSIINEYCVALQAWALTIFSLALFHDYLNKPSRIWYFLSDSSYTVYLFHHSLVIIFGLALINSAINPFIGFPVLASTVLIATLFIHYTMIGKSTVLRFLFNGRR